MVSKSAPLALLAFTFVMPAVAMANDDFNGADQHFGIDASQETAGLLLDDDNTILDLAPEFGPEEDIVVGNIAMGQAALSADGNFSNADVSLVSLEVPAN